MPTVRLRVHWSVTEAIAVADILSDIAAAIWDAYHEEICWNAEEHHVPPANPEEDDMAPF